MAKPTVCPWWMGRLLLNPLRKWVQDPATILAPYVRPGMWVLEPGPGMGYFTLELARRVGVAGRVVAVDVQRQMLTALKGRADRAGLAERIETRVVEAESLGVNGLGEVFDFVLAFAVVHELPCAAAFFREAVTALKPGGTLLLAEPAGHVGAEAFRAELAAAVEAGFVPQSQPEIYRSRCAVFVKRPAARGSR